MTWAISACYGDRMWDLFVDYMNDGAEFVNWLDGEGPFSFRGLVSVSMTFVVLLGLRLAWDVVFH